MILVIAIVYAGGVFVTPFLFGLAKADQDLILPGAVFWPLILALILFGMAYEIGQQISNRR